MNPDTPQNPREQLEMRVTALLLGELTPDEATALREVIAKDPQLAALEERLKHTIELIRETAASPAEETAEQPAPPRMSEARREKLLAQFKTVAPKEFTKPSGFQLRWLIPMSAAAAVMLMLSALLLPALSSAKSKSKKVAVLSNLRQLDGAKQQWAIESKASTDAVPTMSELQPYLGRGLDQKILSVAGETYVLGKVGEPPSIEVDAAQSRTWANGSLARKPTATPGKVALTFDDGNTSVQMGVPRILANMLGSETAPATATTAAAKEPPAPPIKVYEANVVGYVNVPIQQAPRTTIVLPETAHSSESAGDKVEFPALGTDTRLVFNDEARGRQLGDDKNNRFYTGTTSDDVGASKYLYNTRNLYNPVDPNSVAGRQLVRREAESNSSMGEWFDRLNGTSGQTLGGTGSGGNGLAAGGQLGIGQSTVPTYEFKAANNLDINRTPSFSPQDKLTAEAKKLKEFDTLTPEPWGTTVGGAVTTQNGNLQLNGGNSFALAEANKRDAAAASNLGDQVRNGGGGGVGGGGGGGGFGGGIANVGGGVRFVTGSTDAEESSRAIAAAVEREARFQREQQQVTIVPPAQNRGLQTDFSDGAQVDGVSQNKVAAQNQQGLNQDGQLAWASSLSQRAPTKGVDWTGTLQQQHFAFGNNPAAPAAALPAVNPPTVAAPANSLVGDPSWIGVLDQPDQRHSASNQFFARFPPQASLPVPTEGNAQTPILAHRWSFNGKLVAENAPTSTAPISVNSAGFVNNGQIDTGVEGTYAQSQQEKARSDAVNPTGLFPGTFFPTSPSGIPGANTLISPSTSDGNDRQGQRQVVTAIGGRIDKLGEAEVTTASGRESQAQVITGTYFGGINAESKDRVDGLSALTTQAGAKPVEAEHEKAGKDLALRTDSDSDPRLQGNDLYLRLQSTNAIMPAQAMHGSESSSVHVIDLKNADPAEVNKTLADLFPEAQQNGSMPLATRQQSVVQVPSKSAIPADATEVLTDNFSNGQLPGQNQRRASETAARGGRTEIALPQVSASGGTFRAVQPESSSSRSVNPTGYFPGTFYPDAPIQAGTEISKPILALKSAYPSAGKQGAADMLSQAQQRDSLARAEATGIVLPTSAGTTRDYPNSTTPGPVQATYDPQTGKFIVITDDKTFASVSSVLMAIDRPKIETNVDSQDKQMLQTRFGSIPTPADLAKSSTYQSNQVAIAENVQNGRFYLEMGDLDNAEAALKQALTKEPSNVAALHYLELAAERRAANSDIRNQLSARKALVQVESDWDLQQRSRQATNKSNAYALRDGSATGKGREEILSKLKSTKVESVKMPGVPLREALANLTDIARNRDPQGTGINFFVDPRALTQPGALDANGVPLPSGADIDRIADSKVQLDLVNGRLEDVLDAIVKNSNPPLKYEIRDSAVMFSLKDGDSATANQKVQAKPATPVQTDPVVPKPALQPPVPQPEVLTRENAFSTFSLNVSDVSFKLAGASLDKGALPEPGAVRAEEFINAFDYRDPEAGPGVPIAFASERAHDPFAQNRDFLRFSVKTAAAGRQSNRPLNIVLLLDNSGSMERADRVQIIHEALRVLASQLKPQDRVSVITFSRLARLWVDGIAGNQAGDVLDHVGSLTPEGGTNLEEAMKLAYATALRHYLANGMNRVVMLTDGAANLGNVDPATLKQMVETQRQQGIALDCFGVGWEGFNDDLLEELSRNGDGRYGFINSPEEASTEFAGQLAGALQVAASDVKVQVEFNPQRVSSYRQIGYAKHQLTKEQFRDNTVDAAEIAAAEAGNALYTVETNPAGEGPVATVRVRYRDPGTRSYYEKEWVVPYNGPAGALDQGSAAMRLAAASAAFAEWLAQSPFASEVSPDRLLGILNGVPEVYGADARPKKLETMIREAKSITGQ